MRWVNDVKRTAGLAYMRAAGESAFLSSKEGGLCPEIDRSWLSQISHLLFCAHFDKKYKFSFSLTKTQILKKNCKKEI